MSNILLKLKKLSEALSSIGMSESQIVKSLFKGATPLEGYFPVSSSEPHGSMSDLYADDYDEDGEVIPKELGASQETIKVNRPVGILRNIPGGREVTDPIEDEINWYDSMKMLKNKIILIPFDFSKIKSNPSLMESLGEIWGMGYDSKFVSKIQLFESFSYEKLGDRDILKNNFPSLWSDISSLLNKKGIAENEAIYMFYNQEGVGIDRLADLFERNPEYIAHDIGHVDFDFSEDGTSEFKEAVESCMFQILGLYKTENDDEDSDDDKDEDSDDDKDEDSELGKTSALEAINDDYDLLTYNAAHFFDPIKESSLIANDVLGDIFAAIMNDEIKTYIPNGIYLHGLDYKKGDPYFEIKEEDKPKVQNLLDLCVAKLKNYVYGKDDKTVHSGPFYHMEGYVVWF
jgi:hypothetical protein